MIKKNLLIIFTRNPELGKVKTRLAKSIGDQSALDIYKILLNHTLAVTKKINCKKSVWYSEKIRQNDIWDNDLYIKHAQKGNDLGEKMEYAFSSGFANGYEKIVIIGSDLYDLKENHLTEAFEHLDTHNAVIGPAKDGGYYLLGLNTMINAVFSNKNWGNDSVLKDTLYDLKTVKTKLLEELNDIDYVEDIQSYEIFKPFIRYSN